MPNPPGAVKTLQSRVTAYAAEHGTTVRRIQTVVANTIVGQMLPPGVVKGGTAMKFRVGELASRFTPDFDATRAAELDLNDYLDQLEDRLAKGWGDFTGSLVRLEPRAPEDVPAEYVMQPFEIRLAYKTRHWLKVSFELGRDEVGSTLTRATRLAPDIVELFGALGLPEPEAVPVLGAEHQIAQKLHACTHVNSRTGTNDRAHDLVDLQILAGAEEIDLVAVDQVGFRLFESRKAQAWPATVIAYESWDTLYAEAASGLDVLPDVKSAVEWANRLIEDAVNAGRGAE